METKGNENKETKICKYCQTEISKKAKICPNCRKKQNKGIGKWFIIAAVLIVIVGAVTGGEVKDPKKVGEVGNTDVSQSEGTDKQDEIEQDDFSDVETVYELAAGYYTAGIDIPVGKCNVVAVSGTGNLQSSNMFNGGINEVFGIDKGNGLYTESFNGLKLPENTVLYVRGDLVIKVEYTSITGRATGRKYDEENVIELSDGNYIAGEDFPVGVYTIEAVSGRGNLISSNLFDGGVNEMFGIDNGNGWYIDKIQNVELGENVDLEVKGGLTIKLIPANIN